MMIKMKSLKIILGFLFLPLILISCDSVEPKDSKTLDKYGSDTDYVIYSVVLDSVKLLDKKLVLMDSTQFESTVSFNNNYYKTNLPEAEDETFNNYISRNQTNVKLEKIEGVNSVYYSEVENPFQNGTIVSLSKVGYNENKTQAILTIGITYAPLAGYGSLFLLKFENGKWKVVGSIMTWIS